MQLDIGMVFSSLIGLFLLMGGIGGNFDILRTYHDIHFLVAAEALVYTRQFSTCHIHQTGVDLLLMGFLPEYRAKGANALLFADLIPRYQAYGFKWRESQVEMESNEGEHSQWGPLAPTNHKRRRCYRKTIV